MKQRGENDGIDKTTVAERFVQNRAQRNAGTCLLFWNHFLTDQQKTDQIAQTENKDGDSRKQKPSLGISCVREHSHDIPRGNGYNNAAEQGNHFLDRGKHAAFTGIHKGISPFIDHRGYEIIAEIGAENADHAHGAFVCRRNRQKRDQIECAEEQLSRHMKKNGKTFFVDNMFDNKNGEQFKQKRQRNER